jgi:hypothetical protein
MATRQRRYSKEEMARRGQELYESVIRQQVEADKLQIDVIERGIVEITAL